MVKIITSLSEFNDVKSKNSKVVLDCFAQWCGPCKMIAPTFEKLSKEHTDVVFCKFDVDEVEDLASNLGIEAMPTFIFFKDGKEVERLEGANEQRLRAGITKLQ